MPTMTPFSSTTGLPVIWFSDRKAANRCRVQFSGTDLIWGVMISLAESDISVSKFRFSRHYSKTTTNRMICLISNPGEPLRLKTLPDRTRAIDEADKARRRQTLLNSALELFLARPTELPSVQSIASRAGLAKGTVYLYFDTKEEIFLTILKSFTHRSCDHCYSSSTAPQPCQMQLALSFPSLPAFIRPFFL